MGEGGVNQLWQMKKYFALVDVFKIFFNNKSLLGRVWEKGEKYYVGLTI